MASSQTSTALAEAPVAETPLPTDSESESSSSDTENLPKVPVEYTSAELAGAYKELSRPFPAESIKFRILVKGDKLSLAAAYLDVRSVLARINHVAPLSIKMEFVPSPVPGALECRLHLFGAQVADAVMIDPEESPRPRGPERFDRAKSACSNAIKRAAVHIGVGRFLYAMPKLFVKTEKRNGKDIIPPSEELRLRNEVRDWLNRTDVIEAFGIPLSHGEVDNSISEMADGEISLAGINVEQVQATVDAITFIERISKAATPEALYAIGLELKDHENPALREHMRLYYAARLHRLAPAKAQASPSAASPAPATKKSAPTQIDVLELPTVSASTDSKVYTPRQKGYLNRIEEATTQDELYTIGMSIDNAPDREALLPVRELCQAKIVSMREQRFLHMIENASTVDEMVNIKNTINGAVDVENLGGVWPPYEAKLAELQGSRRKKPASVAR